VTSDLPGRVYQHREGLVPGFTKRYGCKLLVWFEAFDDLQDARQRELRIKEWKRSWKIRLIEEKNLEWDDLYPTLF
jgi:putative endonuclease